MKDPYQIDPNDISKEIVNSLLELDSATEKRIQTIAARDKARRSRGESAPDTRGVPNLSKVGVANREKKSRKTEKLIKKVTKGVKPASEEESGEAAEAHGDTNESFSFKSYLSELKKKGAVSKKISHLVKKEGRPQAQAVAITLSKKRRGELGEGHSGEFQGQLDPDEDDSGRGDSEEARKERAQRTGPRGADPQTGLGKGSPSLDPDHAAKAKKALAKKRPLKKKATGRGESLPKPSAKEKWTNPFVNP